MQSPSDISVAVATQLTYCYKRGYFLLELQQPLSLELKHEIIYVAHTGDIDVFKRFPVSSVNEKTKTVVLQFSHLE
jgi:hypothetical protein